MSKEAYYFSHDSNARHDPKILGLRAEYGISGYGIYWVVVEMLREANDYKLPTKAYIWNAIAMQVQCKDFAKDDAKKFVDFCINECDLFETDGDYFWSNSLLKRMDKKNDLSKKRSEAAKKRWKKDDNSAVPEQSDDAKENNSNANAMQNDANAMQDDARKGKEKKEKEKKVNKDIYKDHVKLTQSEYNTLVEQLGEKLTDDYIERLANYIGSTGKRYKSHYHTILTWRRKDVEKGASGNVKKDDDAEREAKRYGLPF